MSKLNNFLAKKGQEYVPFDPSRARRIFGLFARDFLPSFAPQVIHIVGTNGKGSTGRYIALGLAKKAQILHFSSPHLLAFNERFYRNEGVVAWEELEAAHQMLAKKDYMQEASYFEYATFLALFLARDLEFLILEAGLGGEFDSTNVVSEKISVFTQIGLDHMELLGESLEEIARTKLNSMGRLAFLGIQNHTKIPPLARKIAQEKGSELCVLDGFEPIDGLPLFLSQNFALAQRVLASLGHPLCSPPLLDLLGRMQRPRENIWLDVGHNLDSARAIAKEFSTRPVRLVYNAYAQKDVPAILRELRPIVSQVEILDVKHPRIMERAKLEEILRELGTKFCAFEGFKEGESYLVFGSFSVVAQILENL